MLIVYRLRGQLPTVIGACVTVMFLYTICNRWGARCIGLRARGERRRAERIEQRVWRKKADGS
jgi:hypothetical protein